MNLPLKAGRPTRFAARPAAFVWQWGNYGASIVGLQAQFMTPSRKISVTRLRPSFAVGQAAAVPQPLCEPVKAPIPAGMLGAFGCFVEPRRWIGLFRSQPSEDYGLNHCCCFILGT